MKQGTIVCPGCDNRIAQKSLCDWFRSRKHKLVKTTLRMEMCIVNWCFFKAIANKSNTQLTKHARYKELAQLTLSYIMLKNGRKLTN